MMGTTDPSPAALCFSEAEALFAKGHYLDAQVLFDAACRQEPHNPIYREAQQRLYRLAFAFGRRGGVEPSGEKLTDSCGSDCCEGCCEACCEGGCESMGDGGCCDSCCDGCDCDCG